MLILISKRRLQIGFPQNYETTIDFCNIFTKFKVLYYLK